MSCAKGVSKVDKQLREIPQARLGRRCNTEMDFCGDDKIGRLLRLKRYEQPPSDYFGNFLHEFRRRQRDELLREAIWNICTCRMAGSVILFGDLHSRDGFWLFCSPHDNDEMIYSERQMTTPNGICGRCGAKILGDTTREVCPACLLEIGDSTEILNKFGDFEIARREDGSLWELGRGGMGVTYRARDSVLHRSVALKVIAVPPVAGDSEVMRERFLRKARAAAALRHPNVAAVYHFGTVPEPDCCFYAMELVEGEKLEARVHREGPLKVAQVLEIGAQVTRALIAAANQGLIHRDLKPGNIMLTRSEDSSAGFEVKVIDFGLAKVTVEGFGEMDLTHGGFVGTPSYASPEQFAGSRVDARSDIYSLGASLWFALTGHLPCAGNNVEEIRRCQTEGPLPVQQLVARKVPASLIELLRSMLAVDPEERPASARELMEAIEECRLKCTGGDERTRRGFFAELRHCNVYKVAIAYAVIAWLLMQIATQVFPFLEIPNWAIRLVIMLLALGFPVALVLTWAFELTPEGIKRAEDVDLSESMRRKTGRKIDPLRDTLRSDPGFQKLCEEKHP
jgi:protein kinase-like protein